MLVLLSLALLALFHLSDAIALPFPLLRVPAASQSDSTYQLAYGAYQEAEGTVARVVLANEQAKGIEENQYNSASGYMPVDTRGLGKGVRKAKRGLPQPDAWTDTTEMPISPDNHETVEQLPSAVPMSDGERSETLRSVLVSELRGRYTHAPGHFWTQTRGRGGRLTKQHA